jgi:hypothetical protein
MSGAATKWFEKRKKEGINLTSSDSKSLQQFGYKQELKRELGFWDVFIFGLA